jgi:hypothetical protein
VAVLLLTAQRTFAQPAAAPDTTQNAALRAFLDCGNAFCDQDYLVTKLTWVNWMRDRLDADFHLLLTRQATGAGGAEWVMVAIGQRSYSGKVDTLRFISEPNDASDKIRRELLRVTSHLLLPHAAKGAMGPRLQVGLVELPTSAAPQAPAKDRWDFWTYSVGGGGNISGESQQSFQSYNSSLTANRITEAWKIRMQAASYYNRSSYTLSGGTTFIAKQRNLSAGALAVKSMTSHWSLGGRIAALQSDYHNTALAAEAMAAAEWNYFPYQDFTRRKLALLYAVGARDLRYETRTIYDRMRETRPIHSLDLTYGARQPWGDANITLVGAQYLDALDQYKVGISGMVTARLGKGFSFELQGDLSRVRDQLYLPRGNRSDEEVISRIRALQTNYRFWSYFGLRYQFGSIFNSVVNPRFGASSLTVRP